MNVNHVCFYVDNAATWRDWFVHTMSFAAIAQYQTPDTAIEVVQNGGVIFLLASPLTSHSPVAHYLQAHPPGVADVAFQVRSLTQVLDRAIAADCPVLQAEAGDLDSSSKWAIVTGWGDLQHTLIEQIDQSDKIVLPIAGSRPLLVERSPKGAESLAFTAIDHVVLNVAIGDLSRAVSWYETTFGFHRQQTFAIATERSALSSQVLMHADGTAQLPINEPASANSQIQEFLDLNRGAGVQHIALHTNRIVQMIATLRQQGLALLTVPPTYYEQLQQRSGFGLAPAEWDAIAAQQVLVDWQPDAPQALLLQAFTQPIFAQPTFFFELIERQTYQTSRCLQRAEGFGEGNFRALFEAVEREQMKRSKLS
ncbi:MAG: 4-hydroxyphenylpyruvate dioxygenase [Leptolyngbyaceae cyanobacterium SL_7_1]|nr:4-hydroxyphenylpyruvate dioxygenase [Leptolyngbyaceae cyanobacterium SL_7_1]